jgi:peptidoglycan/LPS O-acetylase OafA/YrhL
MPELDTIRGLAILGVFVYHALYRQSDLANWSGIRRLLLTAAWPGQLGVNLFFVLSGFLITGILADGRSEPGYYVRFYKRRALRILPVYFVMVVVLALTRSAPLPSLVLSLFYLTNVARLFGLPTGYSVLWSLAVEEQFYLVWPPFCRNFTLRRLMMICSGIILLSPVSRFVSMQLTTAHRMDFHIHEYTWNSLDGLACGALLALCLREYQVTRNKLARICSAALILSSLAWCCAIPLGILSRDTPVGAALQITLVNVGFTGLLGLFLVAGSGESAKMVQIPILQFLGYLSYGLYLFHLFLFQMYDRVLAEKWHYVQAPNDMGHLLARMAVVGAVSVAAAYVSRKYFEERFLRLKG